jgi:hypothetical protein
MPPGEVGPARWPISQGKRGKKSMVTSHFFLSSAVAQSAEGAGAGRSSNQSVTTQCLSPSGCDAKPTASLLRSGPTSERAERGGRPVLRSLR